MTDQLPSIAVANAVLLRAIQAVAYPGARPYASLSELAGAADTRADNLNRKLSGLEDEGLIHKVGEASWEVALTDAGQRALQAMAVFDGSLAVVNEKQIEVHYGLIDPNPYQPRTVVDHEADIELGKSVKDKGILQRVLVRPHPTEPGRYQQALGHRRVRAAKWANIDVPVEVRELTDDDMADIGVIENVQRSDLHWMDEAEGYLMLTARGRSAAQIQQLVGSGGRKKRSIQELIQFARELDDDAKARARLPEGDAKRITVDQARAMVGNKRPKPALDLSPKMAVTMLELLFAADYSGGETDEPVLAVLHARPVGGPLITLTDRRLISFQFSKGQIQAVIPITEDLAKYLDQIGYAKDPFEAVYQARSAVIGELAAGVLAAEHRHLTAELNPPESAAVHPREGGHEPDYREPDDYGRYEAAPDEVPPLDSAQRLVMVETIHKISHLGFERAGRNAWVKPGGWNAVAVGLAASGFLLFTPAGLGQAVCLGFVGQHWIQTLGLDRDENGVILVPDKLLFVVYEECGLTPSSRGYVCEWLNQEPMPAGGALINSKHEPSPAPTPAVPEVGQDAALILIELAHKIEAECDPNALLPLAEIDAGYRDDAMSNQLVFERLILFKMVGAKTFAGLTALAREWLKAECLTAGFPPVSLGDLQNYQEAAGHAPAGLYATPWLTVADKAATPKRDSFMQQVMDAAGQDDGDEVHPDRDPSETLARIAATLRRLMAAARHGVGVINTARNRKLKPEETEQALTLIEAALSDAERDLASTAEPAADV